MAKRFPLLPAHNLPPITVIPGEFSGYYDFSNLRYESYMKHSEFYAEGYRYGFGKDAPYWEETGLHFMKLPKKTVWVKHMGKKLQEKDFLPLFGGHALFFREDLLEFVKKHAQIDPDITFVPLHFSHRNKDIIPPQPYYMALSEWLPSEEALIGLPDGISSEFGVQPYYSIEYQRPYFKTHKRYDLVSTLTSWIMFSEKLALKMIEFDSDFQFDPLYYPPEE